MPKHSLGYVLVGAILLIVITGFFFFNFWSPSPEWNKSPQNHVITIGEAWTEVDYNYIPDVQIWGDGYIVWVEHSSDGTRNVLEGRLSQKEMVFLIQKLIKLDFFKMFRKGKDYAGISIIASLLSGSHSEWLDPDNKQLYDFASYLKNGAGTNGTKLLPTVGTLYAVPIEKSGNPANTKAQYYWPNDKFHQNIETLAIKNGGIEITGDELKFAWEIVNSQTPTVDSNGKVYWIYVKLPKVSP